MTANAWKQYGEIKRLFENYCYLHEDKRYEDFIKELTRIMHI